MKQAGSTARHRATGNSQENGFTVSKVDVYKTPSSRLTKGELTRFHGIVATLKQNREKDVQSSCSFSGNRLRLIGMKRAGSTARRRVTRSSQENGFIDSKADVYKTPGWRFPYFRVNISWLSFL